MEFCRKGDLVMLPIEQELKATLDCVELLKSLPPTIRSRVAKRISEAFADEHSEVPANGKPSKIRQLIESEEFKALRTAQNQYVAILRTVFEADPHGFAAVAPTIKGRKRKYFGVTQQDIADSGTSTKPVQICPGGWWADLNNSTEYKQANLKALMRGVGYSKAECDLACKAIR